MTAADIARLQDGRVTPENVRPRAKNPIIAGFFREATGSDMVTTVNYHRYAKQSSAELIAEGATS